MSAPCHLGDLRERHRREKRDLILQAAAGAFAERGVASATVADIARRAGVSASGIYLYFSSREELVFTVVLSEIDELERRMTAAVGHGDPAPAVLRRMVRAYVGFYRDRPEGFRMLMGGLDHLNRQAAPEEVVARYDGRALDCLTLLHDVVAAGMAGGSFREGDAWQLTHTIWGACHGILRLAADQPDHLRFLGYDVEALVSQAADALIDGIARAG